MDPSALVCVTRPEYHLYHTLVLHQPADLIISWFHRCLGYDTTIQYFRQAPLSLFQQYKNFFIALILPGPFMRVKIRAESNSKDSGLNFSSSSASCALNCLTLGFTLVDNSLPPWKLYLRPWMQTKRPHLPVPDADILLAMGDWMLLYRRAVNACLPYRNQITWGTPRVMTLMKYGSPCQARKHIDHPLLVWSILRIPLPSQLQSAKVMCKSIRLVVAMFALWTNHGSKTVWVLRGIVASNGPNSACCKQPAANSVNIKRLGHLITSCLIFLKSSWASQNAWEHSTSHGCSFGGLQLLKVLHEIGVWDNRAISAECLQLSGRLQDDLEWKTCLDWIEAKSTLV